MIRPEEALAFRDQFRKARGRAQKDAEGFEEILLCVERLGSFLEPELLGLSQYQDAIARIANRSPLASDVPRVCSDHAPFSELYHLVREGRNRAVHEGSAARNLTHLMIVLSLTLEDALGSASTVLRDLMVSNPTCAYPWEPLSFARQKMLQHEFSFLPLWLGDSATEQGSWRFISDRGLAKYLRAESEEPLEGKNRTRRLTRRIGDAIDRAELTTVVAKCLAPTTPVHVAAKGLDRQSILVVDEEHPSRLLGIVTAFDLL